MRGYLAQRFQIAVRIRTVAGGVGHRIDQVRKPENRHLVDVRFVAEIPPFQIIDEVQVIAPPDLIRQKLTSFVSRSGSAKRLIDLADIHRLLLAFLDLRSPDGVVTSLMRDSGTPPAAWKAWEEIVAGEIAPENDEDGN